MNSFASRTGGKKSSRSVILPRFHPPDEYDTYVEVFGGAGWIFFAEQRQGKFEILNDYDSDIANLYYCVQNKTEELLSSLEFVINSRLLFDLTKSKTDLLEKAEVGEVKRAADFYTLMRQSYGNNCKSYGCKVSPMRTKFPIIAEACGRLQNTVIENKDFENVIKQYDCDSAMIYCDPPYFGTESHYAVNFGESDHIRLRDTLLNVKGKFMLSYGDCAFIRELYGVENSENLHYYAYERADSLRNISHKGSVFKEILIANYDMEKCVESRYNRQLCLSDFDKSEELE
ncbi:MAG: DNA adenine methylase [Tannerella sp.]|jgi:DNA adenine methylase|nr:DNA adenine methylase [Tannerella sp.]